MNQKPAVNKDYWQALNSDIIFCQPNKAYYGSYILRADLDIIGASMRYYQHGVPPKDKIANPTKDEFTGFLRKNLLQYNYRKILNNSDTRYLHVQRTENSYVWHQHVVGTIKIYDSLVLYNLYNLLKNKPANVKLARQFDSLRIYANHEDDIISIIEQLGVEDPDVRLLSYPDPDQISTLRAGKEFNAKANEFKYKVFLQPTGKAGTPDLKKYLDSISDTDEVEVPRHCQIAMAGNFALAALTAQWQRSYMYVRNEQTILLIRMLAGDKFSNYLELAMPIDK